MHISSIIIGILEAQVCLYLAWRQVVKMIGFKCYKLEVFTSSITIIIGILGAQLCVYSAWRLVVK